MGVRLLFMCRLIVSTLSVLADNYMEEVRGSGSHTVTAPLWAGGRARGKTTEVEHSLGGSVCIALLGTRLYGHRALEMFSLDVSWMVACFCRSGLQGYDWTKAVLLCHTK